MVFGSKINYPWCGVWTKGVKCVCGGNKMTTKTRIVNLIWARMSEVGSCKSSLWACTTRSRGFAEKIHQLLVLGNCRIVLTRWAGGSHREMAAGSLEGSWYHNRKGNEAKRIGMKLCISIIAIITLFIICTMGIEWPRTSEDKMESKDILVLFMDNS